MSVFAVAMLAKPTQSGISTAHNSSEDVHGGHIGQADHIGDIHGTGIYVRAMLATYYQELIPQGISTAAMLTSESPKHGTTHPSLEGQDF